MKKYLYSLLALSTLGFIIQACMDEAPDPMIEPDPIAVNNYQYSPIPASQQYPGDAAAGYEYLVNGDYLNYGIPIDIYTFAFPQDSRNLLNRTGDNATIPHDYTASTSPNGVRVVNNNCLVCHSSFFNGELVVGMGNSFSDFTENQGPNFSLTDQAIEFAYGIPSPEWDAYEPLRRGALATSDEIVTPKKGVNPADRLFVALTGHRDRETLEWLTTPEYQIDEEVIPTDVPPWWLLKKKNAMLYTAAGRGDFTYTLMASSTLTMKDSAEGRHIVENFKDVLAYIYSLEPPAYTQPVDNALVVEGKALFEANCTVCHGSYGAEESYPNFLVKLETIQTDSLLAVANYAYEGYLDWHNNSWFNQDGAGAEFVPGDGYIAPPLDGIWSTAPYLHNGSVPNLYTLLNSPERPTYWRRSFQDDDYDYENVGWNYTEEASGAGTDVYDATLPGYGNQGHYFGDSLSTDERWAVIEYLKTL